MSQRITLGLTTVLSVACLLMCWMVWGMNQQNQETTISMQKELQALTGAVATIKDATVYREWIPVKVQLVSDNPLPPGYSYYGKLSGGMGDEVVADVDDSGAINFPYRRPGSYYLTIYSPWGEQLSRNIKVPAGKPFDIAIDCPASPPPKSKVTFSVDLPDDLKAKKVWVVCDFWDMSFRQYGKPEKRGEADWEFTFTPKHRLLDPTLIFTTWAPQVNGGRTILFDGLEHVVSFNGIYSIPAANGGSFGSEIEKEIADKYKNKSVAILPLELHDLQKTIVQSVSSKYQLNEILIVVPQDSTLSLETSSFKEAELNILSRTTYRDPETNSGQLSEFLGSSNTPPKASRDGEAASLQSQSRQAKPLGD